MGEAKLGICVATCVKGVVTGGVDTAHGRVTELRCNEVVGSTYCGTRKSLGLSGLSGDYSIFLVTKVTGR